MPLDEAGAQYVLIRRDAATETGASPFNLSLASSTDDSFRGFLGARFIGVNSWRDMMVAGQIHARWMHEFLSDARFVNALVAALPTAPSFTALGNSLGNEFGSVGAACSLMACKDLNFFVGYDVDFAQRLVAHTGYGGMQFAW